MKAKIKMTLPGYTGNMDDVSIYYNRHLNKMVARRKCGNPSHIPDQSVMREAFALARRVQPTEAYKDDARAYVRAFNSKNRSSGRSLNSWSNLWLKMLRAMLELNRGLQLGDLEREDLLALPCRSIADAVRAGLLEKVPNWDKLEAEL
jgi:hypothetical protein